MLSYANTCITSITLQLLTAKVNCIQILQSKCSLVWRQINLCAEMQPSPARVPYNWFRSATYDSVTEAWGKWPEQLAVFSVRATEWRNDEGISPSLIPSRSRRSFWRSGGFAPRSFVRHYRAFQPNLTLGKKYDYHPLNFAFSCLSFVRFFNKSIGLFQ